MRCDRALCGERAVGGFLNGGQRGDAEGRGEEVERVCVGDDRETKC